MGLHQVTLIPGYGHVTETGEFDMGERVGTSTQMDVMHDYMAAIKDNLELHRIRYNAMEVGLNQKIPHEDRYRLIDPNTLVLHLCCGWFDQKTNSERQHNQSSIYYANSDSSQFAKEISEVLGDWGQCLVYGHRAAIPKLLKTKGHKILKSEQCVSVRIEPFATNGPHADIYLDNLDNLGMQIALAVSNYARTKEQSMFVKPPSHLPITSRCGQL